MTICNCGCPEARHVLDFYVDRTRVCASWRDCRCRGFAVREPRHATRGTR